MRSLEKNLLGGATYAEVTTMSSNMKNIAMNTMLFSRLQAGREKIETDQVLGQTLTIIAFDFATINDHGTEKVYPIVIFEELPDKFLNGGALLNKLCKAWAEEFDGDPEAASEALQEEGGVPVRFGTRRSASGNTYTTVEIM